VTSDADSQRAHEALQGAASDFMIAMMKLFVERELFEPEVAEGMLEWMHSHLQRARRGVAGRGRRRGARASGPLLRPLPGVAGAARQQLDDLIAEVTS
jgi:hypothetical protein